MRQYITPKQLNELREKGKKRLRKWLSDHKGYEHLPYVVVPFVSGGKLPLLSIGQMIEFLDDDGNLHNDTRNRGLLWGGRVTDELADDLWKAVREILNER